VPNRRLDDDDDILTALAAVSPAARQLVDILRARHKPGRRRTIPAANYRKLQLWLESFRRQIRRQNSDLDADQAARKFLRVRGKEVEKLLGFKFGKRRSVDKWRGRKLTKDESRPGALLNAVTRGVKETGRVEARRRKDWKVGLTSLGETLTHGKSRRTYTDPDEHTLVTAAMRRALLGGD
jgi:hypothetical protein